MQAKEDLLFFSAYQQFYKMAESSTAFAKYCRLAFGEDFSQDGFSDVKQLDMILNMVHLTETSSVLDMGCGNGKMLQYIKQKTGSEIYGFDYSDHAIDEAKRRTGLKNHFQVALLGEKVFTDLKFDLVISMDTMYFAPDMTSVVEQITRWLKPGGIFICGYQEGDVMEKTENEHTTVLAQAFQNHGCNYQFINYTRETYEMLKRKRDVILSMKKEFIKEKNKLWYSVIKGQTEKVTASYEDFCKKNARYIYSIKNNIGEKNVSKKTTESIYF